MSVALLSFEEDSPRGSGETGATTKIARALDACGIDAPTSLYDEALALAQEGRLAPASERLRMLLCLDPNDGEAAMLLGKVLAAREQWQEALSWLDTAAANGAFLPPGLRDSVDEGLRRHVADAEEYRTRVAARERGEIRNLRSEAKRLRTEVISLEAENETLRGRVRMWAGITAVVAGSASALMLAALLFGMGGGGAEAVGSDAAMVDASAELPALPPEVAPAAASAPAATTSAPVAAAPVAAAGAATVSVPVEQPFAASAQPDATGATTTAPTTSAPVAEAPKAEAKPASKAKAESTATGPVIATHTVKKGENLGSIAKKYYGDSSQWPRIQAANSDKLGGGHSLQVGMKLQIPKK